MNNINLNTKNLSYIVWKIIMERSPLEHNSKEFFEFMQKLDLLEEKQKRFGSISLSTAWILYSFANYFEPKNILEIGSYLGKSLFSLLLGAYDSKSNNKIIAHCCDKDHKIFFPKKKGLEITQYHQMTSTEMLKKIKKNFKFDFFHFDGRILNDDIKYLREMSHDQSIYIFDDFEMIEKGVLNYSILIDSKIISKKDYFLITPPSESILKQFNLKTHCSTACAIPYQMIRFTSQ